MRLFLTDKNPRIKTLERKDERVPGHCGPQYRDWPLGEIGVPAEGRFVSGRMTSSNLHRRREPTHLFHCGAFRGKWFLLTDYLISSPQS